MADKRYSVREYNFENLVALFCEGSSVAERSVVERKPQVIFINQRCAELGVKTLVLEPEYIDRHFSEDFGGYYAKCHSTYTKKCARLHYFGTKCSEEEFFEAVIAGSDSTGFPFNEYLGFTVIKPLPETLVGRTCLPPSASEKATFIAYTYRPHLCGAELEIRSLPFQEQDHEIAACATSALWTILHGTGRLFEHPVLTPLQITKRGLASSPHHRTAIPNDGLNIYQIAGVVREIGLDAELIYLDFRNQPKEKQATSREILQGALGAYLTLKVPLLLSFDFELDRGKKSRLHAVAVSGVERNGDIRPKKDPQHPEDEGLRLEATKISRVFAHDDGVGPYSPISFETDGGVITTSWRPKDDPTGPRLQAQITDLMVPLYHQIRLRFENVLGVIDELDAILRGMLRHDRLDWNIFLTSGTDAKQDIAKSTHLSAENRLRVLTKPLPHYVWRAVASTGGKRRFEILYDATELRQGYWLLGILKHDLAFLKMIDDEFFGADFSNSDHSRMTLLTLAGIIQAGAV